MSSSTLPYLIILISSSLCAAEVHGQSEYSGQKFLEENRTNIFTAEKAKTVNLDTVYGLLADESGISSVPDQLERFTHLRYLSLRNNRIELNASDIGKLAKLPTLEYLMLTGNRVSQIGPEIAQLSSLTNLLVLGLGYNKLQRISDKLYSLKSLRVLHLNKNSLQTLPNGISGLSALIELHLEFNPLRSLPADFADMKIEQLFILRCGLNEDSLPLIPQSLKTLEASLNRFNKVPEGLLSSSNNLEYLFLNGNRIDSIVPRVANLKHLRGLALRDNRIRSVPIEVLQLLHLEKLDLQGNRLKPIDPKLVPLVRKGVITID